MKRLALLFFTIFLSISSYSDEIDSLITVLNKAQDSEKAQIYNELVESFLYIMPDSALYYANQALISAEKEKDDFQLAVSYKNKGRCLFFLQDFENSLSEFTFADSLINILLNKNEKIEYLKEKANILNGKGRVLESVGDFAAALEIYQNSANIYEKLDEKEGLARVLNDMGYVHNALGNNEKALQYFKKVYEIHSELENKVGIATAMNNIGIIYDTMGKRDSALYFYFESIEINEELGNMQTVAYLYHNIGIVYEFEGELNNALEYYQKSLKITDEIGDFYGSVSTISRIAVVYREKGAYSKAVDMLTNSLRLADSIQSLNIKKDVLFELSITYESWGNADSALKYYKKHVEFKDSVYSVQKLEQIQELETKYESEKQAQQIKLLEKDKKIQDEEAKRRNLALYAVGIILVLMIALAIILFRAFRQKRKSNFLLKTQNAEILNQKEEIKAQAEELEKINQELEKLSIVASETDNAVVIADKTGEIQWVNKAFERIYGYTKDEFVSKYGKNVIDASSERDIKDKFQNIYDEKTSISYESKSESKNGEHIYMQTTVTPLLDVNKEISKLIVIDSDIRDLKRAQQEIMQKNEEILSQNEEIKAKNDEIEAKNEQITIQNHLIKGSIRYALNIQSAILPPKEKIDANFDNFILYRPKDIVSGDFYWYANPKKDMFFIAAVDCTGHGVPGAFMSMISNMILNEIVNQNQIFSTKDILLKLKKSIEKSLRQAETQNHDGLDIILSKIEKDKKRITFSSAKLPMIIYRADKKEIERSKGDIHHIGGVYLKEQEVVFTENEIIYNKNDVMYLASDGYTDQNNTARRRLGRKRLNELILANAEKTTSEQKVIFENALDDWQQNTEQRDDITLIGIKF